MKFLHFADFHLGMENYGKMSSTGLHQRVEEFLSVLDEIVEHVQKEKIDCVFFAGDAFKNREPSQTLIVAFAERIVAMREAGAQVFLLVGNHDMPVSQFRANTLDIYGALSLDGVYVASDPRAVCVDLANGEQVEVLMMPWIHKQHLAAADVSLEQLAIVLGEKLESDFDELLADLPKQRDAAYGLEKTRPHRVVLLHGTVSGARFGAERSVMLGSDLVVSREMFASKDIDYVALGHLHEHQVLGENPPVLYSGSPVRIDFSEEEEVKGFVVGEIVDGNCDWEFVESKQAASFLTIRLDAVDITDNADQLRLNIFDSYQIKDAIVRVVLQGSQDLLAEIDDAALLEQLESARYVVAIVREVIGGSSRMRLDLSGESSFMSPEEVLQAYMDYKDFDAAKQKELQKKIAVFREDLQL